MRTSNDIFQDQVSSKHISVPVFPFFSCLLHFWTTAATTVARPTFRPRTLIVDGLPVGDGTEREGGEATVRVFRFQPSRE